MTADFPAPQERLVRPLQFLVTLREKRAVELEAAEQGISIGELLRRETAPLIARLVDRHEAQLPPV